MRNLLLLFSLLVISLSVKAQHQVSVVGASSVFKIENLSDATEEIKYYPQRAVYIGTIPCETIYKNLPGLTYGAVLKSSIY